MAQEGDERDSRVPHPLAEFDDSAFEAFLSGEVTPRKPAFPALSMFSNAGIGDYGYRLAGFTFHAHAELRPARLAIAKLNHPRTADVAGDLRETLPRFIEAYEDYAEGRRPALLTGCSPCQGMSTASAWARKGKTGPSDDHRNVLPFLIADAAQKLQPRIVVVENVPSIMTTCVVDPATGQEGYIFDLLADRLANYAVFPATLQFADFGIPQRRRRAVFTFIRRDEPCLARLKQHGTTPYPRRTHDATGRHGLLPWRTVRGFLGAPRFRPLDSRTEAAARDPSDPLHYVPFYDADRYDLVRMIPPYSGKSAYETEQCPHCSASPQPHKAATCVKCDKPLHSRPIVLRNGKPALIVGHATSYKRMPPDLPASTITTANGHLGSDTKIHPWENRLLSPRECATLQTIPRDFKWGKSPGDLPTNEVLRSVIGEAVPPWFTYLHGLVLYSLLRGGLASPYLMPQTDQSIEPASRLSPEERATERRRRFHRNSGKAKRDKARAVAQT